VREVHANLMKGELKGASNGGLGHRRHLNLMKGELKDRRVPPNVLDADSLESHEGRIESRRPDKFTLFPVYSESHEGRIES